VGSCVHSLGKFLKIQQNFVSSVPNAYKVIFFRNLRNTSRF
jgi:hypothetical protein